ncbi:MAG: pteridine reductase [Gammaproteobacteria bacterium]|nr:MAG: pteridine reductase [Gammaproteobacteria bacterium]
MANNRVILITGAAKRLGANTARYLHQRGYNIVLHYHRSRADADSLADELNQARANSAITVAADLLDCNPAQLAEQAAGNWGRLDVLINNASSFYPTALEAISEQDWQALIGTNLKAPLQLSQACAKYLRQQQGCIINMIDIYHDRPMPGHVVYSIAKAGLAGLNRSLALELAPDVRVNGIAPGAILWPEHSDADHEARILRKIPLQRTGQADDIAQGIAYLIRAHYVTGHILPIDGGRSLNL